MTPENALLILDQATAQLNANRTAHEQIAQALLILQEAIKPVVETNPEL